jgi:hypothetical protein
VQVFDDNDGRPRGSELSEELEPGGTQVLAYGERMQLPMPGSPMTARAADPPSSVMRE